MTKKFNNINTRLGVILIALVALAGVSQSVSAQNRTTVMVMAETSDSDSLERDNRVNRRILDAMMEQMNAAGFDTYDEMSVTSSTRDISERRYNRAELMDIARNNVTYPGSNRPLSIRAVVTYETYINIQELGYTNKVRIRVTGRVLDVQTGRFLGTYELVDPGGALRLHPTRCQDRECIMEQVGDAARPIGQAVANEIAELLAFDKGGQSGADGFVSSSGPETYSLRFENVSSRDMLDMEEYLVEVFSGYRSHTPVASRGLTHEYDYVSTIELARLKRNLVRAMEELGWGDNVLQDGNLFTVRKSARRGSAIQRSDRDTRW